MERKISKFYLIAVFSVLGILCAEAQSHQELRLTESINGASEFTFSTTDVLYPISLATFTANTSHACFPAPNNYRVNVSVMVLELKSTHLNKLVIHGKSSTPVTSGEDFAKRYLRLSVADSKEGEYIEIVPLDNTVRFIGTGDCQEAVVDGLNIDAGKFIKLEFTNDPSSISKKANIMLTGFDLNDVSTNVLDVQVKDNVFFDGRFIRNPDRLSLDIYDSTGRHIITAKDEISMDNFNNGVYIVKLSNRSFTILLNR